MRLMENKLEYFGGKSPNLIEGQKFFDDSFVHDNDETIFGKKENWNINEINEFKKRTGLVGLNLFID